MTPVLRFLTLLAVGVFACDGVLCGGERPWILLESSRYSIVSQLSEKETRAWALEFDEFTHALGTQIDIEEDRLRPLTIVLFRNDRDFNRFKPLRPGGKTRDVAGIFASRQTWSVIGLSGRVRQAETRRVIFHEGVHWYSDATTDFQPLWLREGLAEVFSTFRTNRGKATWGYEIPAHVRILKSEKLFSLRELLAVSEGDALLDADYQAEVFYAQSWALAHFLMFAKNNEYGDAIANYTLALKNGSSLESAFEQGFGASYDEVQASLKSYFRRGRYDISRTDLSGYDSGEYALRAARPGEVESSLARLALGSGHVDLAQANAQRAVDLDPSNPAGHEMLAWVAVQRALNEIGDGHDVPFIAMREEWPRVDEILRHCNRAAELGSNDAWMYVLLGYHCEYPGFLKNRTSDQFAKYAADQYIHAIALQPRILMAYQQLAMAVGSHEMLVDDLEDVLLQGSQLYPHDGMIVLGLALIAEKTGDDEGALELLRRANGKEKRMIPAGKFVAGQLESRLTENSLQTRVDRLLANGDVSEALELFDLEIARAKSPQLRKTLEQKRFQLTYGVKTQLALDALRNGDSESAINHLQEMLQWDGLSREQREEVAENLRIANRRHLQSL